jgi:RHS repeat-associated protein
MFRSLAVVNLAVHGSSAANPAPLVSAGAYEIRRDEHGFETHVRRDRFGNVVWERDAIGNVTTFGRSASGLVTQITRPDPDGAGPLGQLVTQLSYDGRGNVTRIINPDLTEEFWTYDPSFSRPTSYTDPLGRQTLWQINPANGLVISTTDVAGQIDSLLNGETDDVMTSFTYTTGGGVPAGLVSTMTDALGRVTAMTYTSRGLLASMTQAVGTPDETSTSFEYDTSDNLVAVIDALGRRTEYAYDNLDRLIALTQAATAGPEAFFWQFGYDAAGNRTSMTDPLGNVTEYVYDERGRLSEVIQADPDGAGPLESPVTSYDFDCVNNLVGIADALGRETELEYDGLRRMVRAISPDPDGAGPAAAPTVEMAYNAVGWVTSETDPQGNLTGYVYDAMGRVLSVTEADPDGAGPLTSPVTSFTYDAAGQLLTVTDPLGRVTSYTYDDLGRVTTVTLPDPDGAGPLTAPVTSYGYDKLGNVTSVTDPLGQVTLYAYDSLDRRTTITEADPDGGGPLASPVTTFTYDVASQVVATTDPLGRTTTFEYDNLGRLTKQTAPDPDGAGPELAAFMVYAYDLVGNVLTESNALGHTTTYAYDNLYRLTKITDANGEDTLFTYDYDAEGNITRITNIATGDYRDLEWDYRNRLTKVTQFDSSEAEQWRVEYVYDAFNRMVGRSEFTGGSSTPSADDIFIYDGYQMILTLDASGNVQGRTLWGNGVDQILATEDAAGNVTWPLTDHLNTVRDLVSYDSSTDTTTLENHIVYNSFGEIVSETNPSVESDFKFTARYTDLTTRLQWNLNRWYVPSTGRWASEDPIGFDAGDPNLARYVGNGPEAFADPAGLENPSRYQLLGGLPPKTSANSQADDYDLRYRFDNLERYRSSRPPKVHAPPTLSTDPRLGALSGWLDLQARTHKDNPFIVIPAGTLACPATLVDGTIIGAVSQSATEARQAIVTTIAASDNPVQVGMGGAMYGLTYAGEGLAYYGIGQAVSAPVRAVGAIARRNKPNWTAADFPDIVDELAYTQYRHIRGHKDYRGGGYLERFSDAEALLEAFHCGRAPVIGKNQRGYPVVFYESVTGTHVSGTYVQPTHVFIIKGTKRPSIVPANPMRKW